MNNKTIKTLLALMVLSLFSIIICQFSSDTRWNVTNKRWRWIKKTVFSPRRDIDYAIIGSSYAWCAINPNVLSKRMNNAAVLNLSRNWDGRDADYFIIKELIKHHNVRNIILQFHDEELERVHPYTDYLITPEDAFTEMVFYIKNTPLINKEKIKERINTIINYFANLSIRAYQQIFRKNEALPHHYKKSSDLLKGFYILDSRAKQQTAKFKKLKGKTWNFVPAKKETAPDGTRADFYLDKIWKLCEKHKVNLYFVFIPHYLFPLPSKSTVNYFIRMGEVLIPDIRFVDEMKYWRNPTHLYQLGSRRYTRQLVHLLKQGKKASPFYKYYRY